MVHVRKCTLEFECAGKIKNPTKGSHFSTIGHPPSGEEICRRIRIARQHGVAGGPRRPLGLRGSRQKKAYFAALGAEKRRAQMRAGAETILKVIL